MQVDILSLFPAYFQGPFSESILKRAQERDLLDIRLTDIRDFAEGPHRKVDDRPYGGGPGMVLMPGPASRAIQSAKRPDSKVIFLSPQGKVFDNKKAKELSVESHLIFLCGHYEGVDQRVIDTYVDVEISIGDFVLTNGCLSAIVVLDAIARFIPGVLGNANTAAEDSFENDLLDCPHYTRPLLFEKKEVPEVLRSGHHEEIARWRQSRAEEKTKQVRPDLYARYKAGQGEDKDRIVRR